MANVKASENPLLERGDIFPLSAAPPPLQNGVQTRLARAWAWYMRLPRPIAVIGAVAGFLFLVNVFSGLDSIWFHWPVMALLLIVVLWAVIRRKPS